MNQNTQKIISLSDGKRTSLEIARVVGLSARYVRKVWKWYDLPRPNEGAQPGARNHQFVCGRRIDLDGYVLVTAPTEHPNARQRPNRSGKIIFEHRLVMEQILGRYLEPEEVVDHVDGLTVHNEPSNLRLFQSNHEHLRSTILGKRPIWSEQGRHNILARYRLPEDHLPVDMYGQRRKLGEIRLRQILLAWLSLDKDSPHLLGTHHHLEKARIDHASRPTIQRALDDLYAKWGWPPIQS